MFLIKPGKQENFHPINQSHQLERFFEELRGVRDVDNEETFNQIFTLVIHSWKQQNGEPYQFSSFVTTIQTLMSCLNISEIPYKFEDFRRDGGFVQTMEGNANEE
eukprot:12101833-Ditylum_brightwellii.AAC.1